MAKVYTLSEVEVHNSAKDCWLIVDGKVSLSLGSSISGLSELESGVDRMAYLR